jgi:hypothetical protein
VVNGKSEIPELREFCLAIEGMARKIDDLTELRRSRLSAFYEVRAEPREFTLSRDAIVAAQGIAEDAVELVRELERDIAVIRGFRS